MVCCGAGLVGVLYGFYMAFESETEKRDRARLQKKTWNPRPPFDCGPRAKGLCANYYVDTLLLSIPHRRSYTGRRGYAAQSR